SPELAAVELRDHHCGIASVEHRNPFHAPQFGFTQLYRKDTIERLDKALLDMIGRPDDIKRTTSLGKLI
ncbi:MAG: hypothetical protein ABSD38_38615, partial [Syntrophorhabdales bacterium]